MIEYLANAISLFQFCFVLSINNTAYNNIWLKQSLFMCRDFQKYKVKRSCLLFTWKILQCVKGFMQTHIFTYIRTSNAANIQDF